jgi:hypothetical protein
MLEERVRRRRSAHRVVELVTALLLSLGAVATTYCSYQASLWSSRQATSFDRANALRTESAKASTRAAQLTLIDVTSFVSWLEAAVSDETEFEQELQQRIRREFRPAFDAWLKTNPLENDAAPATPFAMPNAFPAEQRQAEALALRAEDFFHAGEYAIAQTDGFLMTTVILALALFFAGIGHQFRRALVQVAMLGLSVLMLLGGAMKMSQLPRASPTTAERPVNVDW